MKRVSICVLATLLLSGCARWHDVTTSEEITIDKGPIGAATNLSVNLGAMDIVRATKKNGIIVKIKTNEVRTIYTTLPDGKKVYLVGFTDPELLIQKFFE